MDLLFFFFQKLYTVSEKENRFMDFILFYFILFYFILFYFILFCFVLFCFVLFCFIILYFILFYLFYFSLFYFIYLSILFYILIPHTRSPMIMLLLLKVAMSIMLHTCKVGKTNYLNFNCLRFKIPL